MEPACRDKPFTHWKQWAKQSIACGVVFFNDLETIVSTKDPFGFIEKGFRFIFRDGDAGWRRPLDMKPGDIDGTSMNDEEIEATIMQLRKD